MFRQTIAVVDRKGRVTERPASTPTLDVPSDFDREAGVASVDANAQAHYQAIGGGSLINPAFPRPLSWRARGEQCLIASARHAAAETSYRLCTVNPLTR